MKLWTFMEFITSGGRGVISDWVEKEIEDEAEIEFHATLRFLEITPREQWTRPIYSTLDSELGEIRFFANKVQHRVFGFFSDGCQPIRNADWREEKGEDLQPQGCYRNR